MQIVHQHPQTFVGPGGVVLALDGEGVTRGQEVGVGDEVAQVAHVELEPRHLPGFVYRQIVESFGETLFEQRSDIAEGVEFLQPSELPLFEIHGQLRTIFSRALESKQEINLQSLRDGISEFQSLDVIIKEKGHIAIGVGDVVAAEQFLVVEVVVEQRHVLRVHEGG